MAHVREKLGTDLLLMVETKTEIVEGVDERTEFIASFVFEHPAAGHSEIIECISDGTDGLERFS